MGHTFKTKLSWTPRGYDRTLTTDLSLSVGGLPTKIRVTKLPDKMDYYDGDTFDPTGIIVHAYYEDGSDYGTVLNSELSYDPMIVSGGVAMHANLPIGSGSALSFKGGPATYETNGYRFTFPEGKGNTVITNLDTGYQISWYSAYNFNADTITKIWVEYNNDRYELHFSTANYRPDGTIISGTGGVCTSDPRIYGNYPDGSSITVIWHRPADGATLTCPLTLNVDPSPGPTPDPPGPDVPEKVIGDDDVAIPAQAHSGDKTITGANYPNATSVGNDAFNDCSNLKTVNISSATTIGDRAFSDCGWLTSITDESITATT